MEKMYTKLLIITQTVDEQDDMLGFFCGWINEFAKKYVQVTVICLQEGKHHLPDNVRILSLGKKSADKKSVKSKICKVKYIFNFYKYIWQERKKYDCVFVHMNPQYIILGGALWRLWDKKITLWYAHGYVSIILRFAEKIAHTIFTSTKLGFRISSSKVKIVGQGIDIEYFKPRERKIDKKSVFTIVTVGRISPIKDYETLIHAVELLIKEGRNILVYIVGSIGLKEQNIYLHTLKHLVKNKGIEKNINFVGAVSHKSVIQYLHRADLFVSMSHTGSLDKAVLEAMACAIPILTCNEAFIDILVPYKDILIYKKKDYAVLTEKIRYFMNMPRYKKEIIEMNLRDIIIKEHTTIQLIKKITDNLSYENRRY